MNRVDRGILEKVINSHIKLFLLKKKPHLTKRGFTIYLKKLLVDIDPSYSEAEIRIDTYKRTHLIDAHIRIPKIVYLRLAITL